jgi:hypothetical protein
MENVLITNKHIFLCLANEDSSELEFIKNNFCGIICSNIESFNELDHNDRLVYFCGNVSNVSNKKITHVISNFSENYENNSDKYLVINIGEVPINIHNVGVYFRNFFGSENYFESISNEHKFQQLTESNKESTAFRTGLYITKTEQDENDIKFKLLRCSSNFTGPTENVRTSDNEILTKVNNIAEYFFQEKAPLNHVLAQIYNNLKINTTEKKAKIAEHSDKTKDMPKNGLMAFCTFYKKDSFLQVNEIKKHGFDICYNNSTVLTSLRLRLKNPNPHLVQKFDIILYPNSVFLMSLHTNRLYTHAIVPSSLPIDKIPVRMGYVIRSSNTFAVFKNEQTFIKDKVDYVKLEQPMSDGVKLLKDIYYKENTTDEIITYPFFNFSLNQGDYQKPIV